MKKEQKNNEKELKNNIEEIEKEIKNQKTIVPEEVQKINKEVFKNIIIAISIMLYFIFINLGAINIETKVFITDLKVFSVGLMVFTVILFESSYKKENIKTCINGIECMILSVFTMFLPYIYTMLVDRFTAIILMVSTIYAVYYVAKSIIVYCKMKRKYFKNKNDISQIIKK